MKKPVAIVLGGTIAHIELIRRLKRRGFTTVLVDYYNDPPAKAVADEHVQESTLDVPTVLRLAQERSASLVIAVCVDHANVTACYVAEKLHLPRPYSHSLAMEVTDKALMKRRLQDAGISTPRYVVVNGPTQCSTKFRYPVVVKPVDGNSSLGVQKVNCKKELLGSVDQALRASRTGRVVVEEHVQGVEVSVHMYVWRGNIVFDFMSQRFAVGEEMAAGRPNYTTLATVTPAGVSQSIRELIMRAGQTIVEAFGLYQTPLHFEVVVTNDGRVVVLEIMPRIGGGVSYYLMQEYAGYDIIDAAICSFINEKPQPAASPLKSGYYSTNNIFATQGVMGSIVGGADLQQRGIIDKVFQHKCRGVEIGSGISLKNRVGTFVVKAASLNGLIQKTEKAAQGLDVRDAKGESLMRRELVLSRSRLEMAYSESVMGVKPD